MNYIRKTFTYQGKRYSVYGRNEQDAYMKLAQRKMEVQQIVESNMSVTEWAEKCVDIYKKNQKEVTREKYMYRMRHCILEDIGFMPLKYVKPIILQEVLNKQIGKSKTQINEVYQQIRFIFGKAYDNELIAKDPSKGLVKPVGYKNKRRALTDQERKMFYHALKYDERFVLYQVMLECGLRPSEARNLKGKDFEIVKGKTYIHVKGTKTKNADRYVPCSQELYDKLSKKDFCFVTSKGTPLSDKTYQRLNYALYEAMGIEDPDFQPYCFRHTFATDCVNKYDIRLTQYYLGHANISMTSDIYTHIDPFKQ